MQKDLIQRVLEAKEERATLQKQWIEEYKLPLISLTLNLPGGYFQYKDWEAVMERAIEAINNTFDGKILNKYTKVGKWGPEGFWAIDLPILQVKEKAIGIEEEHPLGRLFDIDVINLQGSSISRRDFHIEGRKCMLCNDRAIDCYMTRKHTGEELKLKIEEIINEGLRTKC